MEALARLRSSLHTSLFRNTFFLLTTSALGNVLGFFFWLVVARSYRAGDVGFGATLWGVILFLSGIATLGMTYGIIRFLPAEQDKSRLINAAFLASAVAAVALSLIFFAGVDLWAPALGFVRADPAIALTFILSVAGFAVGAILDTASVASRRADYGAIRATIFGLLRLPIPVFAAGILGILGIVLSWTVALGVSLAMGGFVLLPRFVSRYRLTVAFDGIRNKGIVGYSLWNHAAAIVAAIPLSLLPLMILNASEPRGGPEASAYFFVAAAAAGVLYVVPGAFTTSLFVEGSHPGASYTRDVRHTVGFSLPLLTLGILVVVVLGRWLLGIFGDVYSAASYETLVLLALASPLILVNSVFTTHLRVAKRVRPLVGIMAISSGATLLLAYGLLPLWGIVGAAAAFGLGQALAAPLFLIEWKRNGSRGETVRARVESS